MGRSPVNGRARRVADTRGRPGVRAVGEAPAMASGRVAVVTGGGRGIGRGIVGELAALGLSVVVNYRGDAAAAEDACREAERRGAPRAVAIRADVADPEQGRALLGGV